MELALDSEGLRLEAHLARPAAALARSSQPVLVLCHGLPFGAGAAGAAPQTLRSLADRIAQDAGWGCLTFAFREEPSVAGWQADLDAAIAFIRDQGADNVWVAGFGIGGTLVIRAAALDPSIRGVASLAAPSEVSALPAAETLDPLRHAARIPPRPFLIVHGSGDDTVPPVDARALADAAEGHCELHVIPMGGHQLRHDPRAIAVLLGWLERQSG